MSKRLENAELKVQIIGKGNAERVAVVNPDAEDEDSEVAIEFPTAGERGHRILMALGAILMGGPKNFDDALKTARKKRRVT